MSSFKPLEVTEDPCRCDDCGYECPPSDLGWIEDAPIRLSAGEVIPAGQCPKCGACSYLIQDDSIVEHDRKRADFGEAVLVLLEATEEWNADTLDEIGRLARDRGLSDTDEYGMFRRIKP